MKNIPPLKMHLLSLTDPLSLMTTINMLLCMFFTWLWRFVCVQGALLCWLSHFQKCFCGCWAVSGISMYKQAYKWSPILLFIFILLTVNKAEHALTLSNKERPVQKKFSCTEKPRRFVCVKVNPVWLALVKSYFLEFCLLSFSVPKITYSCILKSDVVMNVTVSACVVEFLL